jgi:hypothetical protein
VVVRSVLFAEPLTTEILAPLPHLHWTFAIPRVLRGLVDDLQERVSIRILGGMEICPA